MNRPERTELAFGVEGFARRRVRVGYARAEYDQGRDVPLAAMTSNTPCNGCTACCRSGLPVALAARESDTGLDVELIDGTRYLRQVDGHCAHLIGGACSVYALRPLSCRAYDCRDYALARVAPVAHPLLAAAVQRWQVKCKAPGDRETRERIAAITHALVADGVDASAAIATAMILRTLPVPEALRQAAGVSSP